MHAMPTAMTRKPANEIVVVIGKADSENAVGEFSNGLSVRAGLRVSGGLLRLSTRKPEKDSAHYSE